MEQKKSNQILKKVVLTILASIATASLILPTVLGFPFIKTFMQQNLSLQLMIGIPTLNLFIIVLYGDRIIGFLKRYIKTKKERMFFLVFIDYLILYTTFTVLLAHFCLRISLSKFLCIYLGVYLIIGMVLFFIGLILYWKKTPGEKSEEEKPVFHDDPIDSIEKDRFGRKNLLMIFFPRLKTCQFN